MSLYHTKEFDGGTVSVKINKEPISIEIDLITQTEAYKGTLNNAQMQELQETYKEFNPETTLNDYIKLTTEAFTSSNLKSLKFHPPMLTFSSIENDIIFHLGTVTLDKMALYNYSKQLMFNLTVLNTKALKLETVLQEVKAERDSGLGKYNDYVKKKDKEEQILFSKFKDLINEKKQKIKELEC